MDYYSALIRSEIQVYPIMWMNLKDITVSEIIQSQKNKYCLILLICNTPGCQVPKDRKQVRWLPGAGVGGVGTQCAMGTESGMTRKFCRQTEVMAAHHASVLTALECSTEKWLR